MAEPHVSSLPAELVEKIVEMATDDADKTAFALRLCRVSQSFHQSAARRLYHSLRNIAPWRLEAILHTSVKLRPQIASWVGVLTLHSCPNHLINEALTVFTSLLVFGPMFSATLDPACASPSLRRFIQMKETIIPRAIARNLTHLCCAGSIYDSLLELVSSKESFRCLTHLLLTDSSLEIIFPPIFNLLHKNRPHGLPNNLEIMVLNLPRMNYHYLRAPYETQQTVLAVLEADPRIIIWDDVTDSIPFDWKRPFTFDYFQDYFNLFDDALGLLPDGIVGLWETADLWVKRVEKQRQKGVNPYAS